MHKFGCTVCGAGCGVLVGLAVMGIGVCVCVSWFSYTTVLRIGPYIYNKQQLATFHLTRYARLARFARPSQNNFHDAVIMSRFELLRFRSAARLFLSRPLLIAQCRNSLSFFPNVQLHTPHVWCLGVSNAVTN